jgi:hypothetical protein
LIIDLIGGYRPFVFLATKVDKKDFPEMLMLIIFGFGPPLDSTESIEKGERWEEG